MGNYTLFIHEAFEKVYEKLDTSEKVWVESIKIKLKENPSGKILRYSWLREKRYLNKRLYYLVDEENKKILILAFGSKKEQSETIFIILNQMKDLLEYLKQC